VPHWNTGKNARGWSFLAVLLPYIEQENLYKLGNIPSNTLMGNSIQSWRDSNSPVVGSVIKTFLCPSDQASTVGAIVQTDSVSSWGGFVASPDGYNLYTNDLPCGLTSYKGVMGTNWGWGNFPNPQPTCCCLTFPFRTYVPAGPSDPWVCGNGMFPGHGYRCKRTFGSITDGTSNTLMIGESTYIGEGARFGADWAGTPGSGMTAAIPPNYQWWADITDWGNQYGARSNHPGGVQFVFADGSVHFISQTIALSIYRSMATISGGEIIPGNSY
jgi:prepilin-type processing-associated H-X9-DG protein